MFKTVITMGLCMLLAIGAAQPVHADDVQLVRDGKAVAQIVVSPDALPQVKYAAKELQSHIQQMSGAELPIVQKPDEKIANTVYVGESEYTRKMGLTDDDLQREEFRIVTGDHHIVLLGGDYLHPRYPRGFEDRSDKTHLLEEWQQYAGQKWDFPFNALYDYRYFNKEMGFSLFDASGTLFGVYELLEQLGVRWYMPGELGTVIPERKTIEIAEQDVQTKPLFERRFMRFSFPSGDKDGFVWSKRQRLGMAELAWMSHGTPEVTRFLQDSHPEYFANIGGQLALRRGGALPRLAQPLADAMVDYSRTFLRRYPEMRFVSVGPADALTSMDDRDKAAGWLHEDRGINGRMSEYVWRFVNNIAGDLKQTHPDHIVMGLAYSYYRDAPHEIATMHENVGITFCQNRTLASTPEDLHKLHVERQKWIDKLPSGEFYIWEYYLNHTPGKQTRGVPAIFTRIAQEDAQLLVGKSKGEYVECSWAQGGMAFPALNHYMYRLQAKLYWDVNLDREAMMDEYCELFFGPAAKEMKTFFTFAEEVWTRPLSRHITLTGGFLRQADVKRFFAILDAARAKVEDGSVYAKRIDLFIEECQPMKEIHPKLKRLGPDFVAKAVETAPSIDGQLDDAAWQSSDDADAAVKGYPMRDLRSEEIKDPGANVKLRWADDNSGLYIAVTSHEPAMASMNPPVKHNDSVSIFDNDVVEVFLETQTRSTFHLAINANGAIYDSCSDAQMNPGGMAWNSQSKVGIKRGADHWVMELFIPIASLGEGAARPTRDEPWGINVCRTRFHENLPQNSAISPSHGRFNNIARFGDLYVE